MKKRNGHDTAQHAFDLIVGEVERAKKLEAELRKLQKIHNEMKMEVKLVAATAASFIRRKNGESAEGFALRKLLLKTVRRAA